MRGLKISSLKHMLTLKKTKPDSLAKPGTTGNNMIQIYMKKLIYKTLFACEIY